MKKITIIGPQQLYGEVKVQGEKNSAMKHVIIPLATDAVFELENIPDIGSIRNLNRISEKQGAVIKSLGKNRLQIDTRDVKKAKRISAKDFFYTSVGAQYVPFFVHRFGEWRVEKPEEDKEVGGDQIGRTMDYVYDVLAECGIKTVHENGEMIFSLENSRAINDKLPQQWVMSSVLLLFSALFKNGTSVIENYTKVPQFADVISFLQRAGAEIEVEEERLLIHGPCKLHGTKHRNIIDRNDLVTWISAAIATNSEISITNTKRAESKLEPLEQFLNRINAEYSYSTDSYTIKKHNWKLKPTEVIASSYPYLSTDWQPILGSVLMQIEGTSKIIDARYPKRLFYWKDLEKFGAKYEYYTHPDYPEVDNYPRAVKIYGQNHENFKGANVTTIDLRAAVSVILAALSSKGKSVIIDEEEHIERGYEEFFERLKKLGAEIKIEQLN
jgi:UDP-N-acetylglucosamine 1-carboxyvinyltransferase